MTSCNTFGDIFHTNDPAFNKQAEKLKSCKMKEGWMKNDEGWMINDDDLKLLTGFADEQTEWWTDIGNCRVAFASENVCPDPRQPQRHY